MTVAGKTEKAEKPALLEYQLQVLTTEIETVNASIRQMDEITKSMKEWTIGLWTASVGGALATRDLTPYVGITAVIPLLFWIVDTWHRRIQRKFIWRGIEIGRFLNGDGLKNSMTAGEITGFRLFDPQARDTKDPEFKEFVSWKRVMLFPSIYLLYGGLTLISLALGIGFWLKVLERGPAAP